MKKLLLATLATLTLAALPAFAAAPAANCFAGGCHQKIGVTSVPHPRFGWVEFALEDVTPAELEGLVEESYRLVAKSKPATRRKPAKAAR